MQVAERLRSPPGSWVTGSVHTMTSTPSYPRRPAVANVAAQFSGYIEAVESPMRVVTGAIVRHDAGARAGAISRWPSPLSAHPVRETRGDPDRSLRIR